MRGSARSPLPWLAGLLVAYLIAPVVALATRAGSPTWSGLRTPGLGPALATSALTATVSTLLIALFGIPLAYLLARARRRWWYAIGVVVALPLAFPPLVSGLLLLNVVGPYTPIGRLTGGRLTDSLAGIVLAQTFVAAPFLVLAARSAFASIAPSLEDTAATLGHGYWSRFRRVGLSIAAPGIVTGLALAWLRAFGEFGATVILAYHPFSLPVYTYVQFSGSGVTATTAPAVVAILTVALAFGLVFLAPQLWRAKTRLPQSSVARGPASQGPIAGLPGAMRGASVVGVPCGAVSRSLAPSAVAVAPLRFMLDLSVGEFRLTASFHATQANIAVLGASGAGKTVTLKALAGLFGPAIGMVHLGDADLSAVPPELRKIGYVPQEPSLLPHLSVWEQVLFGVGTRPDLAAGWIERLGLAGLEGRLPDQLSGGQRQRVAIARALAVSPRLLLLDEPFSSLDTPVRQELRSDLRSVQHELGLATAIVTHDPADVSYLADEVVVLDRGEILQAGPRSSVFARPVSALVASVLGIENLAEGTWLGGGRIATGVVELAVCRPAGQDAPLGSRVQWCVRPEHVCIDMSGRHAARVIDSVDLGGTVETALDLGGGLTLTSRSPGSGLLTPGDTCRLKIPADAVTVWQ